ncbi:MAG: hypothetical protein KDA85_21465, partial [Planctomycetaceae bacterium]|nr:hypothetical protein [Planctomycetaceae bacterium]
MSIQKQTCMMWGLVCLLLPGCLDSPPAADSSEAGGKLTVVATVGMVADVVRNVGGDRVEVAQL